MLLRVVVGSSARPTLQLWWLQGNYPARLSGPISVTLCHYDGGAHHGAFYGDIVTFSFHCLCHFRRELARRVESGDAPQGDNNVPSTWPGLACWRTFLRSQIRDVFCNWDILPAAMFVTVMMAWWPAPGHHQPPVTVRSLLMCHPQLGCHTHIPGKLLVSNITPTHSIHAW